MDVDPTDAQNVADLRLAAAGDADAQLRLAYAARRLVVDGIADEIVCSVEGFSFARLAAAQGKPEALLVMAEHCAHLAKVYADCGAPECAESWHGQALAVLELAAERLPDPSAAGLMDSLTLAAADATPGVMREAKMFHAIWAPAFGAEAFA